MNSQIMITEWQICGKMEKTAPMFRKIWNCAHTTIHRATITGGVVMALNHHTVNTVARTVVAMNTILTKFIHSFQDE